MSDDFKSEIHYLCQAIDCVEDAHRQVDSLRRTIKNAIENDRPIEELHEWVENIWMGRIASSLDYGALRLNQAKDKLIEKRDQKSSGVLTHEQALRIKDRLKQ